MPAHRQVDLGALTRVSRNLSLFRVHSGALNIVLIEAATLRHRTGRENLIAANSPDDEVNSAGDRASLEDLGRFLALRVHDPPELELAV